MLLVAPLDASAQKSDMDLLREGGKHKAPRERKAVPYGIVEGHTTISPLYHSASGAMWIWENYIYPEICTPGGYTDTNTAYFKELVKEYGSPMAIIYGLDRAVRNTKIGRISTPTNSRGLIEDDPKRYRR
jgi:hypothetical protein